MFENGKCRVFSGQKCVLEGRFMSQLYIVTSIQHHRPSKEFAFNTNMQLWHASLADVSSTGFGDMAR